LLQLIQRNASDSRFGQSEFLTLDHHRTGGLVDPLDRAFQFRGVAQFHVRGVIHVGHLLDRGLAALAVSTPA
jgi:hypothetical protein